MGKRELHLCDVTESVIGPCDQKYYKTCPVCDVECCREHFGTNYTSIKIESIGSTGLGALNTVSFCRACATRVAQVKPKLEYLIEPVRDKMVEALRAALAAAALGKESGP